MKNTAAARTPFSYARLQGLVLVLAFLAVSQAATAQSPGPPIAVAKAREVAADEMIRLPGTVVAESTQTRGRPHCH